MVYRQLAKQLRKMSTDAELVLWQQLRLRQMRGFKFRRQHPLGQYVVDFICLEVGLVIELDGGQHQEEQRSIADKKRTAWLKQQGLRVLRFWNHEVLTDLPAAKEEIWNVLVEMEQQMIVLGSGLRSDNPHPSPPPKGGGNKRRLSKRRKMISAFLDEG